MKKYLFIIGLMTFAALSCRKEESGIVSGAEATVAATAWTGYSWQDGDAIGVYTSDGVVNAKAVLNSEGTFTGNFGDASLIEGAYWPYSAGAGNDVDMVKFTVPDKVAQAGDETALYTFATGACGADGSLAFSQRMATLKVVFRNVAGSALEGTKIQSLTVDTDGAAYLTGVFNVSVSDEMAPVVSTVASIDGVTMTFGDTEVTDGLEGYASVVPYVIAGNRVFKMTAVADGTSYTASVTCSSGVETGETVTLEFDASQFEPSIELVWANADFEGMPFKINYPAIDNAGNVYVESSNSSVLVKLSPDGKTAWKADMGFPVNDNNFISPSVEPDGSMIYASGGSSAGTNTRICAYGADGGEPEWVFTADRFFGNGANPSPNLNKMTVAIGDKNIYVGNGGTTGSVLAIDKASGGRISYVAANADGTGGPAGGCVSGPALSASGVLGWTSNYNLGTVSQAGLDNPAGNHETYGKFTTGLLYPTSNLNGPVGGLVCTNVGGEDYIVSYFPAKSGNTVTVISVKASDALNTTGSSGKPAWTYEIKDSKQDQGGIAVGPQGEIIVPLKNVGGNGGLVAVKADGSGIAWQYEIGTDVGGGAAVDDAGNIHFISDANPATYYIVKPDYENQTCDLLASVDLLALAKSSTPAGGSLDDCEVSKSWTSVMIGNDGKMYVSINAGPTGNQYAKGLVMCLTYKGCKGPGNTPWPMQAADCSHTAVQKTVR